MASADRWETGGRWSKLGMAYTLVLNPQKDRHAKPTKLVVNQTFSIFLVMTILHIPDMYG